MIYRKDIWVPKYKHELITYLKKFYPNEKWVNKTKKQLYAVYFNIRRDLYAPNRA